MARSLRALPKAELGRRVERAEAAFVAAVNRVFAATTELLLRATRTVTAAADPLPIDDAAYLITLWSEEVPGLVDEVGAAYGASASHVASGLISRAGAVVPVGWQEALDPHAATYLANASNRMVRTGDLMWSNVRGQLHEAFVAGESIDDMKRRLTSTAELSRRRARTVARTEVISASNAGAMTGARALPDGIRPTTKTWSATGDARTRPTHDEANGQTVLLDEKFAVGGDWMDRPGDGPASEVINCRCVGGATAVSARGVKAVMRRWYTGPMVRLTLPDGELLITPNHPVATPTGWQPAETLREGDYVMGVTDGDVGRREVPAVDEVISRIEDVWHTLDLSSIASRVDSANVDLYGDAFDGDVDIASVDLCLPLCRLAEGLKHEGEFPFPGTECQVGTTRRPSGEVVVGHAKHVGLGASSGGDAGVDEDGTDDLAGESVAAGERLLTLAGAIPVQDVPGDGVTALAASRSHAVRSGAQDPSLLEGGIDPMQCQAGRPHDVVNAGTGLVQIRDVIRLSGWSGHVYDLSTTGGWFLAANIIVHNCSVLFDAEPLPGAAEGNE